MVKRNLRAALLLTSCLIGAAHAKTVTNKTTTPQTATAKTTPAQSSRGQPVGFVADKVDYDRGGSIVVARGHVQAWQGDQILLADSITFDRNSNKAVARGHVVMVQPNGEVIFAQYAELSQDMRNGIFTHPSALLANNGKLVGNAGRRINGKVNELSRAVYTACDLCKSDPSRAPEWEIRASDAVQDLEHQRIEYTDATIDVYGVPVFWMPYMTHADPSVKRESGFLVPDFGWSSQYLGSYVRAPYYWVIDGDSDAVITPTLATESGPDLDIDYRRRFNAGMINADVMGGRDLGAPQGLAKIDGSFTLNDEWRYGTNIDTVTSATYLRDTNRPVPAFLESNVYLEGFGMGSWAKVSATTYQSTTTTTSQSTLPYVLPRANYSYYNVIDPLGGRFSLDSGVINVLRATGTNTERANLNLDWQRPFHDGLGGVWNLRLNDVSAYYSAFSLNQTPSWSSTGQAQTVRSQPTAALNWRYPLLRADTTGVGSELIEPIVQLVASPRSGDWRNPLVPNEDSLDLDFSDANLFALNRYTGIDRQDGGNRVDVAMHGAWYGGKNSVDVLFGQSFRSSDDSLAVLPDSGLEGYRSDYVGHINYNMSDWLGLSYRARLDKNSFTPQMEDAGFTVGKGLFNLNGGYFYSSTNPYDLYDSATLPSNYYIHRNELYASATSHWKKWLVSVDARRDLHANQMDSTDAHLTYDDDCFTFDLKFTKRYTSVLGDSGATSVLLTITLKTIGSIGSHSL